MAVRATLSLTGKWAYLKDPKRRGEKQRLFSPRLSRRNWGELDLPANWYKTEVGDYHGVIWFAREFELPAEMKGRELTLRFNAVDYIAEVWLNGVYLGRHEGFFAPFEFHVTKQVKTAGTNTLVVKVDSPYDESEYRAIADDPGFHRPLSEAFKVRKPVALTTIKGSLIDFWHRPGWQTQFGQDGNTGGIWQGVELIATGAVKIDRVKITTKLVDSYGSKDGTALLDVDVELHNRAGKTVRTTIGLEAEGKNFASVEEIEKAKEFVLTPGRNVVKLVHTLQQPVLWWCWDQGEPNLYQMKVQAEIAGEVQDEVTETFGVREFKLDENGQWYLNGKRVFARGMRYHSSIWAGEGNEGMFRDDLGQMKSFNINAIRIGSHVEKPEFYDLCDEMGFMVWQNFPLHWGNYADTDDVIERTAPMMAEMVRMLYNHPGIVIWSTFKEPLITFFQPRPNLYGRLCEVMRQAAEEVDPTRWVHKGDYGEGVQNVMTGGWGEKYVDFRRKVNPNSPQVVEYGTVALCPLETARQILKPEEQWPPDWDRWHYLNLDPLWLHLQGVDCSALHSLEEAIEASQTWAARQIKESIEYLRQRKYHPTASMFQYFWSDPWPCLGGSGNLDYYRRPYKSYDIFGMVYTPVLVSIEWVKEGHYLGFEKTYEPGENLIARIWATNDRYQQYDAASLTWRIIGPAGNTLLEESRKLSLPEDSSQVVAEVNWAIPQAVSGVYRMEAELSQAGGELLSRNYFEFRVEGTRVGER